MLMHGRNPYFIGINSAILLNDKSNLVYNGRNPYFIGINSAILIPSCAFSAEQSRNPYFIGINSAIILGDHITPTTATVAILILLELTLQYYFHLDIKDKYKVAILILLELTLQFDKNPNDLDEDWCRNPYFIGINSAIYYSYCNKNGLNKSQSLFYWN